MAEYRYYLIPDAMTRAFPEQFGKQTPTEFFDNIADLEKRYHQLREMPYNNERTWNERARFPYARLVVGVDRQNGLHPLRHPGTGRRFPGFPECHPV